VTLLPSVENSQAPHNLIQKSLGLMLRERYGKIRVNL